jgi:hypothetical protein
MSGRRQLRFVPFLEPLDERLNPSPLDPVSLTTLPGQADAGNHVIYHTFALVDRAQVSGDGRSGKIVLWVRESDDRAGPFYTFKANRLVRVDVDADKLILIGNNRNESPSPGGR